MISELFWQCCIFLHNFWTVVTVRYFSKWLRTVLKVWYFSTWFRNCSDSVVYFYMVSELLWHCCIFLHDFGTALTELYFSTYVCTRPGKWTVMNLCVRSIGVCLSSRILRHDFWTVLTVWYSSTWFQNCSDSVVFSVIISELFWQCGIFLHDFGTVLTVLYFST